MKRLWDFSDDSADVLLGNTIGCETKGVAVALLKKKYIMYSLRALSVVKGTVRRKNSLPKFWVHLEVLLK